MWFFSKLMLNGKVCLTIFYAQTVLDFAVNFFLNLSKRFRLR
jgi:hypothetical protein